LVQWLEERFHPCAHAVLLYGAFTLSAMADYLCDSGPISAGCYAAGWDLTCVISVIQTATDDAPKLNRELFVFGEAPQAIKWEMVRRRKSRRSEGVSRQGRGREPLDVVPLQAKT